MVASSIRYFPFGGVSSFNYGDGITSPVQSYSRTLSYGSSSNRLLSLTAGSTVHTLNYDNNGAIIRDPSQNHTLGYNVRGRLSSLQNGINTLNYSVNADGQRMRKQTVSGASTDYLYDHKGLLIGEMPTGSASFNKEYIYLGDIPVAVVQ